MPIFYVKEKVQYWLKITAKTASTLTLFEENSENALREFFAPIYLLPIVLFFTQTKVFLYTKFYIKIPLFCYC